MPVRAFFRDLHDRLSGCPPPVPTKQSAFDGPQGYKPKTTTTTTVSGFYSPTYQRRTKSRDNLRQKSPSSTSRLSPPSDTSSSMASRTSRSPKPLRKLRLQVPLYIYPTSTSWDPLFTALSQHPTVQFDIIINPANGPGGDTPDANYVRQVTRLNTYPNATLFGYVHVKWAERSLEDVFEDVRRYERWNKQSLPPSPTIPPTSASAMKVSSPLRPMDSGVTLAGAQRRRDLDEGAVDIHISGIFVDEAPHHERHLGYMSSLHAYIRRSLSRGCLVWTNPGCPVAERYYEFADKVTCFEDGYGAWVDRGLDGFEGGREVRRKSTVMVHSCPRGRGEEAEVVRRAKEEGVEGVFVTVERGYEGWGVGWGEVVKAVEEA
ncbi:Spherulation-specific family 4-domain-containing protein [Elsinoe ampelina]|uniref:Spherulation-specific family 4-domain-containing protein n=1 Tax=Elsinoe ampelina TaxID=302913 RepID=A0A6A6GMT7_9PEZI|nr:Spherulation-specific family 4-domain-containing protein [Elsinoe ampelina]